MANKPLPYPYKRISLQVPLDTVAAFDRLGATMGRAGSRLMVEYLTDAIPVVLSMEREVAQIMRVDHRAAERIMALAESVNQASADAIGKASAGPLPGHAQRGPEAVRGPLTPPSSNTGGKVPGSDQKSSGSAP
jgi:hypothetical protein